MLNLPKYVLLTSDERKAKRIIPQMQDFVWFLNEPMNYGPDCLVSKEIFRFLTMDKFLFTRSVYNKYFTRALSMSLFVLYKAF